MSTLLCLTLLAAEPVAPVETPTALPQETVDEFSWIIGEWNGVGQPRRGSAVGSWRESTTWEFDFPEDSTNPTAIEVFVDSGKLIESIRFTVGDDGELLATVTDAGKSETNTLTAQEAAENRWEFGGLDGDSLKLTLRKISDIRIVLLVEAPRGAAFRRVAEIGYTRAGEKLANAGGSGRVCIVTGGRGTTAVEHDGKTYYVCCSGCAQAFAANPERIIADAKARAEKAAKAAGSEP